MAEERLRSSPAPKVLAIRRPVDHTPEGIYT